MHRHLRWLWKNCPSTPLWRPRPLIEIGEDNSLGRELSAGFSEEGKLLEEGWGGDEMDKAWAGVDAGKEFHWVHVLDASGRELLSRTVENDQAGILKLI